MGCGSSSLKGEKVGGDLGADSMGPPAKKIRTNFSDVDFSSGAANDRRGTMAVAPDEQRRMTKVSESHEAMPMTDTPKTPNKSNKASLEKARQGFAEPPKTEAQYENVGNASGQVSESIDPTSMQKRPEATPEIQMDGRTNTEGKLIY